MVEGLLPLPLVLLLEAEDQGAMVIGSKLLGDMVEVEEVVEGGLQHDGLGLQGDADHRPAVAHRRHGPAEVTGLPVEDPHEGVHHYAQGMLPELLVGDLDERLDIRVLYGDDLGWAVAVPLGYEADHPGDGLEAEESLEVGAADEEVCRRLQVEHVEVPLAHGDEQLHGVVPEDGGYGLAYPPQGRLDGLLAPHLQHTPLLALQLGAFTVCKQHVLAHSSVV